MSRQIPCDYNEHNPYGECHQWQVFEAIWRMWEAGERGPMNGGVLTSKLAVKFGPMTVNQMRDRCRALEAEGVITRLDSVNPENWHPVASWAPTAALERDAEAGEQTEKPIRAGGHA